MTEWTIHTSDNTSIIADFATTSPNELNTIAKGENASYTFSNVRTRLEIKAGDTYTVAADTVEQWDELIVKDTLDLNGRLEADTVTVDGGTIDKDTTAYDLGGTVIERGETEYFSPAIVPSGETLEVNGTLETQDIDINGNVIGSGKIVVQDFNRAPTNGTLDINEKYALETEEVQKYSPYTGKFTVTETLGSSQKYREFISSSADIDTLLVGIEPDTSLSDRHIEGYWGLVNQITDQRTRSLSNERIGIEITVLAPYAEYADHTAVANELRV